MRWDSFIDISTFGISDWYSTNAHAVDGLIYLIFFLGVAKVTLGRRYQGRGGRAIVVGVGLMLTFAASVSSSRSGFTLDRLAPMSWLVLGVILFVLLIALTAGLGRTSSHSVGFGNLRQDSMRWRNVPEARYLFGSGANLSQDPQRTRSSATDTGTDQAVHSVQETEITLMQLLDAFAEYVDRYGLDQKPEAYLLAIARRHRDIEHRYHRLLTLLAQRGWRSSPDKQLLSGDVESIIQRVAQNKALFNEAISIAEAAIRGGNLSLLRESITKLQLLEQESLRFLGIITDMTDRMRSDHGAHSVWGRDGG